MCIPVIMKMYLLEYNYIHRFIKFRSPVKGTHVKQAVYSLFGGLCILKHDIVH